MANIEVNTISHLLEIEQQASELINQAQNEADKKIAGAKALADTEFQNQYKTIIEKLEKEQIQNLSSLDNKKQEQISSYKSNIESTKKDYPAFSAYLDSILFA